MSLSNETATPGLHGSIEIIVELSSSRRGNMKSNEPDFRLILDRVYWPNAFAFPDKIILLCPG